MSAAPTRARTLAFTAAALIGFAANSLLCRAALRPHSANDPIDAASFTAIRLVSGAVVLELIARVTAERSRSRGGNWRGAFALFGYALAFSFAYLRLDASTGALILFGSVQATMIGAALRSGERFGPRGSLGLVLALGGLVWLNAPGLSAPDPIGALLMACAGIAWGIYSLFGRRAGPPLEATAGNFLRAAPLALAALGASRALGNSQHVEASGAILAVASGALASGVGYSLWYAALGGLGAARASIVQLSVPVLTASSGALVLGESLSLRLVEAGAAILSGVALSLFDRRTKPRG